MNFWAKHMCYVLFCVKEFTNKIILYYLSMLLHRELVHCLKNWRMDNQFVDHLKRRLVKQKAGNTLRQIAQRHLDQLED